MNTMRMARLARGLTQGELAARAGLSREALSRIETGESSRPHDRTMQALSEALNLGAEQLLQPVDPNRGELDHVALRRALEGVRDSVDAALAILEGQ